MSSQQNLDVINVLEPNHKALITHKTHQSFAGQTFAVNFTKKWQQKIAWLCFWIFLFA